MAVTLFTRHKIFLWVESGAIVYMVGEAINVEGVIKVPEERAAELLK